MQGQQDTKPGQPILAAGRTCMDRCLASIPSLLERFEKDLKLSRSIILSQRIDDLSLTSSRAWQENLRQGIVCGPWLHR